MATIISSSQSLHLLNPKTPFSSIPRTTKPFSFNPLSPPPPTFSLHRLNHHQPPPLKTYLLKIKATSTASPPPASPPPPPPPPPPTVLSSIRDSTRTISAIFTTIAVLSKLVLAKIQSNLAKLSDATPEELNSLDSLRRSLVCSVGPLFFAAVSSGGGSRGSGGRVSRGLNTPLTVVAAGMGRWLEIYAGVLLVRVLLSWFPNIPWDRQPLSAIRDLCDPYLNLFRNIIPPVLGTLDVSPIFAFTVLGVLGGLMRGTATSAMY